MCDPLLGFKTNPQLAPGGRPLNARGFRGPDLDAHAHLRVVALGDSCTFGMIPPEPGTGELFARKSYPERLQDLATTRHGPGAVSVLNAGVCGYNSFHGIMLLRSALRSLHPDLVTVKYGWNDLMTSPNALRGSYHEPSSTVARAAQDIALRTALYPFIFRLVAAVRAFGQKDAASQAFTAATEWQPNVPFEEYENNLRRIVELASGRGAVVWLVTSADAFLTDAYRGNEDAYAVTAAPQLGLIRFGGIRSFQELTQLHRRYNDIVRRVGAELGVPVVDMESVYRAHASEDLFALTDALHPTELGHEYEAEALYAQLVASGMLQQGHL